MRIKERISKYIIYPVLLAGVTLIFFFDTLFLGNSFSYRDIYRYFYPYKKFASEWLRSGVFPHWNSLNSCGTPFFAGLQSQVAYPLSIFHYILPFNFGFNLFIAVHLFLAGLFVYFLCLDFRFKKYSAFFAGVIFAFSGYMVSSVEMLTTLSSVIWVPLILLVFKKALEKKGLKERLLCTVVTGALLTVQFLGGEPTIVYVTLGMLAMFSLLFLEKKPVFVYFGTLFLAFLFSSFQLLPFLEFLRNSDRYNQPEAVTRILNSLWSFPPEGILSLFIPSFFKEGSVFEFLSGEKSQIWLKSAFIGLLPSVLAISSVFYGMNNKLNSIRRNSGRKSAEVHIMKEKNENKKYLLFFVLIGFISLFLAVGRYNIFYEQMYSFLPGYKQVRFPVKYIFPVFLSIAFLSGYTLEKIFETGKQQKYRLSKIVIFSGSSLVVLSSLIYIFNRQIFSLLVRLINPAVSYSSLYYAYQNHKEITGFVLQSSGILFFAALVLSAFLMGKLKKRFAAVTIIFIVLVELFICNEPINQRINSGFFKESTGLELFLKENQGAERTFLLRSKNKEAWLQGETFYDAMYYAKNRLYVNQNMLLGIRVVSGYDSILVREQYEFLEYIEKNRKRRYLNILSAKYIVTEEELDKKVFPLIYSFDGVSVYENKDSLPRCFVAKNIKCFDEIRAKEYIINNNFDPKKETIIYSTSAIGVSEGRTGKVEIIEETPNTVKINALLPEKSFVVLNDTYYPGWEVFVDKKKEKIYRVNGIFRGLVCPQGKHEIFFKYNPKAFKIGLIVSFISVLTIICILFVLYFKKPAKKGIIYGRAISKTNRRSKK